MDPIIKVIVLSAMVRLLVLTSKPWLCAGIYGVCTLVLAIVSGEKIARVMTMTALALVATCIYFWLLDRIETSTILWWVVAIIGLPLVLLA